MPRQFYTFVEHKNFFPLLFPKDSEYLKFLDIALREVGAKRPLNGVNKWRKFLKNFFRRGDFTPFFCKKSSNLRPLLSITFPQGFRISKNFGHWTLGCGSKKTVKHSEQSVTERQTHKRKTNRKWQNPL